VADRKPRRQQYALPSEYGPARAPRDGQVPDDQAVRTLPRDAPPPDPAPEPSRRERRQSRDGRGRRARRSPRARWIRLGIVLALVVVLIPVAWSYVHALNRPGTDSLGIRTVEWIRDHGGNGIVNTIERWWYTNNPPVEGGDPRAIEVQGTGGAVPQETKPSVTAPPQPIHLPPPTARVPTPAPSVEPNEGIWMPVGRLVGGLPAEYITFVRPDAVHTSFYVALMWLDTKLARAQYVPGLVEPGGGPNPWGAQVPEDQRSTLLAAFNSGFKMDSARGGVYFDGQEVRELVDGAASLVIRTDGSATVGKWNRDFTMGPDIASVRQNLELLVDNGQLNPELRENDTTAFGATLGNNVYVWRSGVGVDANGALIYAGGNSLSVLSLAKTLQAAGAVRAMELDINTAWVNAFTYVNENNDPAAPVVGIKLGGDMAHEGDRYLQPGERDFFAFFANPTYTPHGEASPSTTTSTSTTSTTSPPTTTTPRR
jgi:hypothetical protein